MTVRTKERQKTDLSPTSHPLKDENWKLTRSISPKFSMVPDRNRFIDAYVKKKAFVPAPCKYKFDNYEMLARGPSPHYKRGR